MIVGFVDFDEENDELPPVPTEPLPDDLNAYLGFLRTFFEWLKDPSNSVATELFTSSMISSGGTVSQFMLDLLSAVDQKHYPWSMLDDSFVVRTAAGKASAWLQGQGAQCALELEFARELRLYQS